ncbi:MAG: SGNH/GDSL hydrolase family protein [Acidobacteriota bacterium]
MTTQSPLDPFDRFCLRLGRGLIVLSLPLLVIVGAEGLARLLHEPAPIRRVYDPFAHRISQPNLVDRFESLDGEHLTVQLNELGMRGPRVTEPLAPDALTLVFLGGSTTENYAFPRPETFPGLIAEHLRGRLGRPVRVFNAGMSAATTGTSLGRLQHQVLDLEPSLVVVMHGINDLVFGFHPSFRTDGRHLQRPPEADRQPRSYLLDWLRLRRSRNQAMKPAALGPRRSIEHFDDFLALRVFERNLRSMAAIATAHEVPILFLTQATRYRLTPEPGDRTSFRLATAVAAQGGLPPDIPSLARGMSAFNAAVLELPAAPGVHVFDLAAQVPLSEELIYDECHFTRAGNQRVAEVLGPIVESILR